ncbi:MAG: hypothetical protein JHC33_03750 [Ignisphaera sp.]|nr:hypothetical protein [Ignisphaera sp.]
MNYNTKPFNPDDSYPNQVPTELSQADDNFTVLSQSYKDEDPNTKILKHTLKSDVALCGGVVLNNTSNPEYLFIPYSKLNISQDGNPPHFYNLYTSYYSLPDNKLFYFDGSKWVEVNWQEQVINDPWYKLGKLRIYNNELQVSNDGITWHKTIPTVGRYVEFTHDSFDTSVELYGAPLYDPIHISVGQTYIGTSVEIINVACVSPSIWDILDNDPYYTTWGGLYPSGQFVSGGWASVMNANGYSISTINDWDMQIISQQYVDPSYIEFFQTNLDRLPFYFKGRGGRYTIHIVDNRMFSTSLYSLYGVDLGVGYCPFPNNGYFLGAVSSYMYKRNNTDAYYSISITRRM